MSGKRQKNQLELAFMAGARDGIFGFAGGGTEPPVAERNAESPAKAKGLMEEILDPENLKEALKRVKANKGSAGVDRMTVDELTDYLRKHWPEIREQVLSGTYKPQPVLRVEIPKPAGGVRKLGIPVVVDRWIQQAVMQVLQCIWDRTFSENSFGFRPNRSAHQAVGRAQEYLTAGYTWVVDLDLEKFFDRVNHDKLMGLLAKRITDKRVLKLIRAFLNAGVMEKGLVNPIDEGTPQGGPLSPLLSNIVLDELDRELERRGHRFVRYADDCNIYVRSQRSGQRVMESVTRFISNKLKLKVNSEKSAVARPWERKFLGFSFTAKEPQRRRIAPKAMERFKERVRGLTRRTRGVSLEGMVKDLTVYLRGWHGYFGFCQTPTVLTDLDGWIRRKLRCVVWKQWKRGRKRYKELRKRGVSEVLAAQTAGSSHGPWRLSHSPALCIAFPNVYFDGIGLFRLAFGRSTTRRTAVYGPVRTVV
jgi:RNA-directed DNA polymerase